ncbi:MULTISPECIES: hypothetical protein [unclassified Pseudovibrio]|uniref:hypothetical protein n=1 Tax=unclassified Pseudovibrio TaxID=2627060 RepID=UPI0007AE7C54|nr:MULTISPECIES: hypothetical protein [unclassified Pseudovibrio]KZL00476.1 hypothetical protein PsW74_02902 [Pseudovibrio sp. W74]KZL07476.1 hypothetical protein PsAD14_03862 [Pseudovibrio sp. Ad14]
MVMRSPKLLGTAIVSDDAVLAARLTSALARRHHYLAVLDGPRLARDDAQAEVIRRNNALARINANKVILSGLSTSQESAMATQLPQNVVGRCADNEVEALASKWLLNNDRLRWGRNNIGVGLLRALYEGRLIEFDDVSSTIPSIAGPSRHHVVCEAGEPMSEIIAANYAYSLGAGLTIIPKVANEIARRLLEDFYQSENGEERQQLQTQLRELCGEIKTSGVSSLTFFTKKLPFGVGFPTQPSTHIFTYPDCGVSVANGFAAEQKASRGVNVAVLVDPQKTTAPEIDAALKELPKRSMLVRAYRGRAADVRSITDMVDHFPYDLLLFATHCGDAPGWRCTYEYRDSEGIDRNLVVDEAIGVSRSDDPDKLQVTRFNYFQSLDGVDWSDPVAKENHYIGTAINDYGERIRTDDFKPVSKEPLARVKLSAAMAMHDNNYMPVLASLAGGGSPIVINNACVSWHELAGRFTFGNARAYVGTLYPVLPFEAESVVSQLFDGHWGKYLPEALCLAQIETYGPEDQRRPYVITGVYTQKLRAKREDVPKHIMRRLSQGISEHAHRADLGTIEEKRQLEYVANYYRREAIAFLKKCSL